MSKEMQYRNDGMAFAYKIAKEQGIEALEKEISSNNASLRSVQLISPSCRHSVFKLNRSLNLFSLTFPNSNSSLIVINAIISTVSRQFCLT